MATKIEKKKKTKEKKVILKDASQSRRLLSYIIDWYVGALATAFPIAIVSQKIYGTMLRQDIIHFEHPFGLIGGILGLVCGLIYFVVVPLCGNKGQTFGKKVCKIKIVQDDGQDVTLKNIILRQLVGIIIIEGSLVTTSVIWHQIVWILTGVDVVTPLKFVGLAFCGISILLVLFKKDHKAIHDYLGKTKVIMCE